jgi:hypothetical protein
MRRSAFVLSCIMAALFSAAAIFSWTTQPASAFFSSGAALIFVFTLLALRRGATRTLQMPAVVLNALALLASVALVSFGVNFSAGASSYAIAGSLLAFLCTPPAINIVALRLQLNAVHLAKQN